MANQIPAGELGQRLLTREPPRRLEPVAHEDIRVLAPAHRAAHDQALYRGTEQQLDQRPVRGLEAGALEPLAQLRARQWAVGRQRAFDHAQRALRLSRVDPDLGQARRRST